MDDDAIRGGIQAASYGVPLFYKSDLRFGLTSRLSKIHHVLEDIWKLPLDSEHSAAFGEDLNGKFIADGQHRVGACHAACATTITRSVHIREIYWNRSLSACSGPGSSR